MIHMPTHGCNALLWSATYVFHTQSYLDARKLREQCIERHPKCQVGIYKSSKVDSPYVVTVYVLVRVNPE